MKHIFFKDEHGLGNKIYGLIVAVYLYKKYRGQCVIHYIDITSIHQKSTDNHIKVLFPKTTKIIRYTTESEYNKFREAHKDNFSYYNYTNINSIDDLPEFTQLNFANRFEYMYHITHDCWNLLSKSDKQYFDFNKKVVSPSVLSIPKKLNNYAIVHVRYGDKLKLIINHRNDTTKKWDNRFPIYTPEYYIKMIKLFTQKNIPVIIVTDSLNIVKHFIYSKLESHDNVHLMDIHYEDAYYLLLKARYIVMSYSTFSFSAAYINENAECYLVRKHITKYNRNLEDNSLLDKWNLINNHKYTLNDNFRLAKEMATYL